MLMQTKTSESSDFNLLRPKQNVPINKTSKHFTVIEDNSGLRPSYTNRDKPEFEISDRLTSV